MPRLNVTSETVTKRLDEDVMMPSGTTCVRTDNGRPEIVTFLHVNVCRGEQLVEGILAARKQIRAYNRAIDHMIRALTDTTDQYHVDADAEDQ